MSNQKKVIIYSVILISMFVASGLAITAKPLWKTSSVEDEPMVTISVEEAYYGDLDNDTYEDDVYARVEVSLNGANRYNLDYWLTLTLPSGREFTFGWGINTKLSFLNISNSLFDTALESGWYNLHVEIVMKTGGVSYIDYSHDFDPPGVDDEGKPPTATFTLV